MVLTQHTKGVHVTRTSHLAVTQELWWHVGNGAVCVCADVGHVQIQHPAQPKVCQLAHEASRVCGCRLEQHVGPLQVTMQNAHCVQVVHAGCNVLQALVYVDLYAISTPNY